MVRLAAKWGEDLSGNGAVQTLRRPLPYGRGSETRAGPVHAKGALWPWDGVLKFAA
jgi:hypothetical protein